MDLDGRRGPVGSYLAVERDERGVIHRVVVDNYVDSPAVRTVFSVVESRLEQP